MAFTKKQLMYYIYWRTCFRNGKNITIGNIVTFYFLCAYELIAELGPFSPEGRLEQLERLYKNYRSKGLSHAVWVGQYAKLHNLEIKDDDVRRWAFQWSESTNYFSDILDIINGKYSNAFDFMCKKSTWKLKSSTFIKKANCIENIRCAVEMILPQIDTLFSNSGIKFSDYLVGRLRKTEVAPTYYSGSVWNECVIERLGIKSESEKSLSWDYPSEKIFITDEKGNILKKTSTSMQYVDPYLSEYILKYTEMLFRKKLGYPYLTFPVKLIGALKMKFADGYGYVLSADPKLQENEKIYISLYDDIEKVIIATTQKYFELHADKLNNLEEQFKVNYQRPKPVVYEHKKPADEMMINCICENPIKEGQFEKLLKIYDEASPSFKKTKARKVSKWIWDYWILSENHTSYRELEQKVVKNKWFLLEKKAIIERNYDLALPYLCSTYDSINGVASKKVNQDLIKDCIIISFTLIDRLFGLYGIDSSDIFLGEWKTIPWIPFENEEEIRDVKHAAICKNLGDIEIYLLDEGSRVGSVLRHEYSGQAETFISYILKSIENKLRIIIGYKSLLSNTLELKDLFEIKGFYQACRFIDDIIDGVVTYVYSHSTPLKRKPPAIPELIVSNSNTLKRTSFSHNLVYGITDIDIFIKDGLKNVYGNEYTEIKELSPYKILDIDFDNFNFNEWCNKFSWKEEVHQTFAKLNIYRFHDIYDDILDRFTEVCKSYPVEYDPEYNFMTTPVMCEINGLIGKDLVTLSSLLSENEGFLQWLSWIEHGRIVIPRNTPYIQMMFHFAINRLIFAQEPEKCLVVLCTVWNHYFNTVDKIDNSSNILLEWIKDYWLVYCSEIKYEDFKHLFRYDVVFVNENNITYAKDHYMININRLDDNNLLEFYNSNCNYHVLDGGVVKKGYGEVLEEAIEEVHKDLALLWKKYDLNFIEYLHFETKEKQEKLRELFFRGILTKRTKRFLRTSFNGRVISETESYTAGYDDSKDWPVLKYEQYEISNSSSRILLDYIIKYTEKVVRDHLKISYNFKFDDKKIYDLFPQPLFYDNVRQHIIAKTIMAASERVCTQNGL